MFHLKDSLVILPFIFVFIIFMGSWKIIMFMTSGCKPEKGVSNWLTILPISDFGFQLSKQHFCDVIRLRYGKT